MISSQVQPEKRLDYFDQQLNQRRQVRLRTCADVYEQWRAYKRAYKKAPREGLEFQIDYIDTGLALDGARRARAPIALALHGAPGSYHDFALLIQHLHQQQVRVIVPNFPEYVATVKTKVLFRHSADEKAAYLRDFLRAINVTKIDLLVSHSSAIFPTLLILLNANERAIEERRRREQQVAAARTTTAGSGSESIASNNSPIEEESPASNEAERNGSGSDTESFEDAAEELADGNNKHGDIVLELKSTTTSTKPADEPARGKRIKKRSRSRAKESAVKFEEPIEVKAVALLNPAGHRLPKSMKPTWFKCGSCHVYQHKLGRSLFRKLGPAFLTVVGVPVKVDNMDNVMLSATVMRNSKCQRVVGQLEQLSQMKIPTLLVFSENDKLIEKEIFYEMTRFMKLDPNNFDVFNNDGDIELAQSSMADWIRVMVFKAGGHYAYSNYAKTVNQAVSELLRKVTSC